MIKLGERTTRERIMDAAIDLFGAKGVDAVSLDERGTDEPGAAGDGDLLPGERRGDHG